ncbi:MAG: ABC transporter permease, partial [Rhodothermales bacterium]|nr:ABC transporter permease [Rhodothermales bacterium]
MLKNYLTVALRAFRRGRLYAFVNVFGLALGMTTCALIFLLVYHEWSFDRFHEDVHDIYRVYLEYEEPDGGLGYQAMMTPEFTPAFREAFPGIDAATRLVSNEIDFETGGEQYRKMGAEIDPDFFGIFTFDVLAGDAAAAIEDPSKMVLTAETAVSMFGSGPGTWQDALGEVITISNGDVSVDFTVGAVMQDFPNNSSISFDVAFSFENYDPIRLGGNNWGGRTSTYVRLSDTATEAGLESAFPSYMETAFGEYIESMQSASYIVEGPPTEVAALRLQPLTELHSDVDVWLPYEASAHNPMYSWILLGIGTLILLIACINFMTLSVGRSTSRAREVGVRKVLGAFRSQIMRQYWGESFVTAGMAL